MMYASDKGSIWYLDFGICKVHINEGKTTFAFAFANGQPISISHTRNSKFI